MHKKKIRLQACKQGLAEKPMNSIKKHLATIISKDIFQIPSSIPNSVVMYTPPSAIKHRQSRIDSMGHNSRSLSYRQAS